MDLPVENSLPCLHFRKNQEGQINFGGKIGAALWTYRFQLQLKLGSQRLHLKLDLFTVADAKSLDHLQSGIGPVLSLKTSSQNQLTLLLFRQILALDHSFLISAGGQAKLHLPFGIGLGLEEKSARAQRRSFHRQLAHFQRDFERLTASLCRAAQCHIELAAKGDFKEFEQEKFAIARKQLPDQRSTHAGKRADALQPPGKQRRGYGGHRRLRRKAGQQSLFPASDGLEFYFAMDATVWGNISQGQQERPPIGAGEFPSIGPFRRRALRAFTLEYCIHAMFP